MELKGKIYSDFLIPLKFSISGKLATVNVVLGSQVKKGQLLASLDKRELQAYLDRSLKQYEIQRAEFDQKQKENLNEFEKRKIQNELEIAVKSVGIAKANLEQADLYSPIEGIVLEMDPMVSGINVTPTKSVITLVDPNTLYFQAEVKEEDLNKIVIGKEADIRLNHNKENIHRGVIETIGFQPLKEGFYPVKITFKNIDYSNLRLGLGGIAVI